MLNQTLTVLLLTLAAYVTPYDDVPDSPVEYMRSFYKNLSAWDLQSAREDLVRLEGEYGNEDEKMLFFRGVLAFYESRYEDATQLLTSFRDRHPESPLAGDVGFYLKAMEVPRQMQQIESEHFIFRYMPEDEVLALYIMPALEKIRAVMGKDLGYFPPEKVVVEAMPSRQAFVDASPLTVEDIETSGTIAICKYNRLMFTSPRVTVRGYGWLETVAHEYVHYVINRKSKGGVPIWLHEATAKFQQSRPWDEGGTMPPSSESLLAKAVDEDYLIGFDRMHPSFAKLKSRNDVRLAFAQATEVFRFLLSQGGYPKIQRLLDEVAQTDELESAFQKVYGLTLDQIEKRWVAHMQQVKHYRYNPRIEPLEITFIDERSEELAEYGDAYEYRQWAEEGTEEIAYKEVKDHVRLGDLLRDRSFLNAAVKEYTKGKSSSPIIDVHVANKLAYAHLLNEEWDAASKVLSEVEPFYPTHSTSLVRLGEAAWQQGNLDAARKWFERANDLNPFQPLIHARLARIYTQQGEEELAQREEKAFQLLGAPSKLHF